MSKNKLYTVIRNSKKGGNMTTKNRNAVQQEIADMLLVYATAASRNKFVQEARASKQSLQEVVWRHAGKLLTAKGKR